MIINHIFFVGLGGAGQRHLRILKKLLPPETIFSAFRKTKKTPLLNSDFTENPHDSIENKYNLTMVSSLEEGFQLKPNLTVISTPTSLHSEALLLASAHKSHIIVEKPVSHTIESIQTLKKSITNNHLLFMTSYQRQFLEIVKKIRHLIQADLGKIISVSIQVASYVPEWHPYENYKDLYAVKKSLGGGVLLTECHEVDLCISIWGKPDSVFCTGGSRHSDNLDVEDTVSLSLIYPFFTIQLNLCFMQKYNQRKISISGEDGYLECDLNKNTGFFINYRTNKQEDFDFANNSVDPFTQQADYFLNKLTPVESQKRLDQALENVKVLQAAKESLFHQKVVTIKK